MGGNPQTWLEHSLRVGETSKKGDHPIDLYSEHNNVPSLYKISQIIVILKVDKLILEIHKSYRPIPFSVVEDNANAIPDYQFGFGKRNEIHRAASLKVRNSVQQFSSMSAVFHKLGTIIPRNYCSMTTSYLANKPIAINSSIAALRTSDIIWGSP